MTPLLWRLLAVPFLLLVLYSILSSFKYTRMISNIFVGLVYKPSWQGPASARGEKVTILDSSDHEIQALMAGDSRSRRLAIFCHESGQGKESWERYASFLTDAGYRVLSIDFDEKREEAPENSLTQWPQEEDVERVLVAARWAKKTAPSAPPIVLFGISKGANIAVAASSRLAMPNVVVADGLFSMKEIFRDYIRRWAPILVRPNLFGENYPDWVVNIFTELGFWHCQRRSGKKFIDLEKCLRAKHSPILLIHGETDDIIPASHQLFLRKLPKGVASHWTASGAGHNEAVVVGREAYEKKILDFLNGTSEA